MLRKIELDYFADLKYIFELKDTVKGAIQAKTNMGTMGSLYPDLSILLGELTRLEGKVRKQK